MRLPQRVTPKEGVDAYGPADRKNWLPVKLKADRDLYEDTRHGFVDPSSLADPYAETRTPRR
jgi:hypothetical protein